MRVDDGEPMQDVTLGEEQKSTNSERHTLDVRVVRAGWGEEIKGMQLGMCGEETSAKVLRNGCKEPLQPEVSQDQGPQDEKFL